MDLGKLLLFGMSGRIDTMLDKNSVVSAALHQVSVIGKKITLRRCYQISCYKQSVNDLTTLLVDS